MIRFICNALMLLCALGCMVGLAACLDGHFIGGSIILFASGFAFIVIGKGVSDPDVH